MSLEKTKLKKKVQQIKQHKGNNTELISLFINPDTRIQTVQKRIKKEKHGADNIKTDSTRENVKKALQKISSELHNYSETPEHGLALYAGETEEGLMTYTINSSEIHINETNYVCDKCFETTPVENALSVEKEYGLIVIDRNEASIGKLSGNKIQVYHQFQSQVMGKSKAGGQSQARFQRERERQKHEFFKKVSKNIKQTFISQNELEIEGVVIGGSNITLDEFTTNDYLDYRIKENLIGTFRINYGNEQGLKELADRASKVIDKSENRVVRQKLEQFLKSLSTQNDSLHSVYGKEYVEKALQYGAVETLLVSSDIDSKVLEKLSQKAREMGSEIIIVENSFEQGKQFNRTFTGFAALLRYELDIAD